MHELISIELHLSLVLLYYSFNFFLFHLLIIKKKVISQPCNAFVKLLEIFYEKTIFLFFNEFPMNFKLINDFLFFIKNRIHDDIIIAIKFISLLIILFLYSTLLCIKKLLLSCIIILYALYSFLQYVNMFVKYLWKLKLI